MFNSSNRMAYKVAFTGLTMAAVAYANQARFSNLFNSNTYCDNGDGR